MVGVAITSRFLSLVRNALARPISLLRWRRNERAGPSQQWPSSAMPGGSLTKRDLNNRYVRHDSRDVKRMAAARDPSLTLLRHSGGMSRSALALLSDEAASVTRITC